MAIHLYEAILARRAILVWHFYQVFFDPDSDAMNGAWWDGKMPAENYRHEHELDTETLRLRTSHQRHQHRTNRALPRLRRRIENLQLFALLRGSVFSWLWRGRNGWDSEVDPVGAIGLFGCVQVDLVHRNLAIFLIEHRESGSSEQVVVNLLRRASILEDHSNRLLARRRVARIAWSCVRRASAL